MTYLDVRPLDTPYRPSVDSLFHSAADVYGSRVLGIVMTGMGSDGREGSAWIKAKGGTVLTEAEASCVVYGMPRSIVEAGLSDGDSAAGPDGRRGPRAGMTAKILLVDDSAWHGAATRQILEAAGYVVVEAEDGMTALERYFLEKPDVVLLDLVMKGMMGLDVLDKLHRDGSEGPGDRRCRPTSRIPPARWPPPAAPAAS